MAYVYREYPRHVHKPGGLCLSVANDVEKAAALADGWYLTPLEAEQGAAAPVVVPVAPDAVADALEKPRRGRPRKVDAE